MNRQELELMMCPYHQRFVSDCMQCKEIDELWRDWALRHRIEVDDDSYTYEEAERHYYKDGKVEEESPHQEHKWY